MVTAVVRGLPELKRDLAQFGNAVQTRLARHATMAMARVVAKHARRRGRSCGLRPTSAMHGLVAR
jgi:hypothetical protein